MIYLLVLVSVLLVEKDNQSFVIFFIQFLIMNVVGSAPYSFALGSEFAEKTQSPLEKYFVMSVMRLSREVVTAILMILVGALMEISSCMLN